MATSRELLLGEWACLGIIYPGPTHGFAVAARLKPAADVGRVWSLSRPLTYRCIDVLTGYGYVQVIGSERGDGGPNRTIIGATRTGRHRLRRWLDTPVAHLRDLRSELLLKLVLAEICDIDVTTMLDRQRTHIEHIATTMSESDAPIERDVVSLWRNEASQAAVRFLERVRTRDVPRSR